MYALARGKMKIVDTMRNHQQHAHSSRSLKNKKTKLLLLYTYIFTSLISHPDVHNDC